ncbi:transporter substrate-binding domain-containing protein [[Clostridium] fimetarium]|uniref:Polar amino acid transport system substrate-binding protein n=1 Tax=[Clostridium] fimetarium TaxID=99656 RepID=A0A1I0RT66_9FIRM|nr:transporter substrate-binding domain-containing protein [[Clostridium] fimetarium]SEW44472.1 polar amino acid transport system substrate-binding protein [[Clostridium] fimetarium]
MKKRVMRMVAMLLMLITIMSIAGCGKVDTSTWSAIKKEGKFTFACSGGYPPFNYIDDSGKLVGFDVDIANALAEVMGVKAEGITTEWDGILGGLTAKRFDTVIGSMAITDARLEQVNFTNPYYYDGAQFFAPQNKGFKSLADSAVTKVGVVTGTTFQKELEKYSNVKDVLNFSSDVENFIAANQGRTDGLITSRFVGLQAPKEYNLVAVGDLLYNEKIGIAVTKENTELLDQLNTALKTIIDNGTYDKISEKYFGCNILETK